ncbi:MAG: SPOR domain-containing protein, partial [Alphaproteobacteria bacterium HGW-Alphaproteobacteria-8]
MRDESQLYDAYDVGAVDGVRRSRWSAALGAVVSLAVLGAVVVWAYNLGVRDAADVPVVRAVEGPARMRPDDPGGAQ